MKILGVNAFHPDSSACIIIDGKVIAAIEEERLIRVKHWAGFPENSISFCLMRSSRPLHSNRGQSSKSSTGNHHHSKSGIYFPVPIVTELSGKPLPIIPQPS